MTTGLNPALCCPLVFIHSLCDVCFTLAQIGEMCNCFKTFGLNAEYPKLQTVAEMASSRGAVRSARSYTSQRFQQRRSSLPLMPV